jgi:glycerol kinase
MPHVLALDQGTTSSRAIVFDQTGAVLAQAQREFTQRFPNPGMVEHDPEEIWRTQLDTALGALAEARLAPDDLACIGITNQRETTLVWDRATGVPIHPAIVWQDRRTAADCDRLERDGLGPLVRQRTGLVIDAYFSATKLRWLLDHVPGARDRAERGELCFGTVDAWLLWKLTGGAVHATDLTNASRTMLLDLRAGAWDDGLLAALGVPRAMLPDVVPSSGVVAEATADGLAGVPIAGVAGDQQAALFGQQCTTPGMAKNTYGTGCFLLLNTGDTPTPSEHGLISTAAWRVGDDAPAFALEGSVFIAGAVVQWLRDGLGIIRSSAEVETLARSVDDAGGVFLVPALAGLGAPHWDQYARGAILGLTRGTTAAHIARAALEGVAYQVADLARAMEADAGRSIEDLRVDGGAARNDLLMQFQADLLQIPLERPATTESTALGAALLAGLATGVWGSMDDLAHVWSLERRFEPSIPAAEAERRLARWHEAVDRSRDWSREHDA